MPSAAPREIQLGKSQRGHRPSGVVHFSGNQDELTACSLQIIQREEIPLTRGKRNCQGKITWLTYLKTH
ncbi:hypothetical protein C0Q70_12488 [Pomacea canaliculata]|uniref:Uncharacterized protein n=1 Tax=Pomacea canaliculata TaxID=400727 RepID=A0A2T7P1N0_POMCA|nr:hypothetical protein C0Q70_12488 [Pomacea canaliculata]